MGKLSSGSLLARNPVVALYFSKRRRRRKKKKKKKKKKSSCGAVDLVGPCPLGAPDQEQEQGARKEKLRRA
jgi:hypothetical protein